MKKSSKIILGIIVSALLILAVAGIVMLANKQGQSNDDTPDKPLTLETESEEKEDEPEQEPQEEKQEEKQEEQQEVEEETKDESNEEPSEPVLDESKAVTVWTTADVNFRKEASVDGEKIKTLTKETELKKYDEKDGWAYVKCGEELGYVSAEYVTDKKPEEKTKEDKPVSNTQVEAIPGQHRSPNSAVVVIDPGHQGKGDSTKEPNGPGSSTMKARVTNGTTGVATGVPEYVLNLDIGLKLKTELENRGYTVYMTRTTHDVNISNKERAEYASTVGADIAVRIHANGAANASANGAETMAPSGSNPFVAHLANASQSLSRCVINEYCKATGFKNRGVVATDTMTGINWSTVPVTIIELGFMSNSQDDINMQNAQMQNNMVQGIANGIDAYFGF